jgi:hypothetical protein
LGFLFKQGTSGNLPVECMKKIQEQDPRCVIGAGQADALAARRLGNWTNCCLAGRTSSLAGRDQIKSIIRPLKTQASTGSIASV